MSRVAHNFKDKSRTGDVLINENVDFGSLLLSEQVLRGLKNSGFVRPSPIQLKAIPLGRCGLDLIVQAKSGTGKTCVFSVIALESIVTDTSSTQVLVLAPTREIAVQIWEVIKSIGSAMKELECHTFIGGLPLQEDRVKLKKCHISVGSPGRIKQLIESGVLRTDSIRLFVLDEADKLLEESFQEQINWIYSALPENKQMLALSATYPEYLAEHLTAYMRNPTFLRLNISDPALLGIRQYYQTVPYHPMSHVVFEQKSKVLINILSSVSFEQCLVFSNLQTRAQTLADSLTSHGWPTACIAGRLDQKDRNHAMARLKTYKCRILISTDLTSRGIDADKVNMVINLDVPKDHETYLHRIGRAGRFGSFGIAITLISDGQERLDLDSVEKQCNTQIYLLPDPLPSDLAKSECPIFLDDVVSSEVIDTGTQYQAQNGGTKQLMKSPIKFRELDKDTNNKNISDNSALNLDSKENQLGESLDVETVKEDKKVTVNGFKEGNNTKEEMSDNLGLTKNCEDLKYEYADTREAVVYEDIEYNEMNETEFVVEGTRNNSFVKTDLDPPDSKIVETGYVSELKPKLEKELISIHKEDVDDVYRAKDDLKITDRSEVNRLEEIVPGEKLLKSANEVSFRIESQLEHIVEPSHLHLCRSYKISSSPSKEVNISDVYKHNIGYKKLDNSHSYNTAKDLLKVFRDKVDTEEELTDYKIDISVPKVKCKDDETDELKQAVSHLQDLLENRHAISSTEVSFNTNKTDCNRKVTSENSDVAKRNSSISSEDEFEAKDELLNRITNFPLTNLDENELLDREASTPTKSLNAGTETEQTRKEYTYTSAKYNVNSAAEENSTAGQDVCTDDRNKYNLQKARKQRFGYRGNFAIGHLLQQERAKGKSEKCLDDGGHFEGAGDATEQDRTNECDVDNVEAFKETQNALIRNAKVSLESEKTVSELSFPCYENQEQTPSPALSRAFRNNTDVKVPDKDLLVHRTDASDDKETDSESFSVSSVTDSESTVSDHSESQGARPKVYSKDRKTQSRYAKEIATSDKQGKSKSKTASKSSEGEVNGEISYQELWRQWYEQYENWHKQSMNMWGYPGMHQTYFQNVDPYGHYYNSSMNYPYQNYQQGYQYNYTPSSNRVERSFQFQEEYLKQMSKYWKKGNINK